MRWSVTLAMSFLTALGVVAADTACTTGTTTVLVTDCANKPVAGVNIAIKICCTPNQNQDPKWTEFSAESAENGEASFPVNAQQICDGKISFAGFSTTVFGTGSCTKPDTKGNSRCTVQVCKR